MNEELSPEALTALWAGLEQAVAQSSCLSETALRHLLSMADGLSAKGDWENAWQALSFAQQLAAQNGDAQIMAEVTALRGVLHHRRELNPAIASWQAAQATYAQLENEIEITHFFNSTVSVV